MKGKGSINGKKSELKLSCLGDGRWRNENIQWWSTAEHTHIGKMCYAKF